MRCSHARARVAANALAAHGVAAALPGPRRPSASAKDAVDRGVRSANKLYKKGDYKDAYKLYHEALGDTTKRAADAPGVYYNGGNALFMQNQFDRALESYQRSYSPDSTLTGKMLYNRANTLLKTGRFDEAIESYLQALEYLPDDEDARHNLELALAAKQQQKQQQQPRKPGDKGKQQQQGGDSQSDSTKSDSQQPQNSKPDSTQSGKPENQESKPDQRCSNRPTVVPTADRSELRKLSPRTPPASAGARAKKNCGRSGKAAFRHQTLQEIGDVGSHDARIRSHAGGALAGRFVARR
jgi:tetratricopeptide (TPR) repeat protein